MGSFEKKSPRAICLDILNRMERTNRHLDRLLNDSFKQYRHLTPLDRAFLTELTYGVVRWREKLDWIIRQFSKITFEKIELEIVNTLRLGLYQILFLSKTPSSAAVNESVNLAKQVRGKGGAGFVNAILRSVIRKRGEIVYPGLQEDFIRYVSVVHSHPLWLVKRWVTDLGSEETLRICQTHNQMSLLTLRTNTLKVNRHELMEKLKEKGLEPLSAIFSEEGIFLKDPPPTSALPLLQEGFYVIQDEASQLVTPLLDPKPGERILDACAAPGGKTTHMAQKMGNQGKIYALDVSKQRLDLIKEGCHRLGVTNVETIKGDAARTLPIPAGEVFDRILADVPCSGFGTLRRNPDLKWRRGERDIRRLSKLQSSILGNLSTYVTGGGILVYSTCTIFHEENEDVIMNFLNGHPEFRLDRMDKVLPEKCHPFIEKDFFKTFPPRDGMDGFFVARLAKIS